MERYYVTRSKHLKQFFSDLPETKFLPCGFDHWDSVLGEPANYVISKCFEDGLLEHPSPENSISKSFKVDEIKKICNEHGVSTSGRKSELISRLIDAAPDWAFSVSGCKEWFVLSDAGKKLLIVVSDELGKESGKLEASLLSLIRNGKYADAFSAWNDWDRGNAFPSSIDDYPGSRPYSTVDFEKLAEDVVQVLGLSRGSRFLVDVLFDRRRIFDSTESGDINRKYHGEYLRNSIIHPDVVGVRIEPSPSPSNSCSFSKHYAGCYRIDNIPDIPPGPCDNEPNCLCFASVIYADEAEGVEWKTPLRRHPLSEVSINPPCPPEPLTENGLRRLYQVTNELGITNLDDGKVQELVDNALEQGKLHDEVGNKRATEKKDRGLLSWFKRLLG